MSNINRMLITLQHILEGEDIPVRAALDGAAEDSLLKLTLGDEQNKQTHDLEIRCIPSDSDIFNDLALIQFFVAVKEQAQPNLPDAVYKILSETNTELPIGNFGIAPDGIVYFRYIYAADNNLVKDKRRIMNILNLIALIVEVYFPLVKKSLLC